MSVRETTEAMPFQYRFTNKGGGDVGLEVGDDFEPSPAFADSDNGLMEQIGLSMVRIGLQFMGHSADSAKMLCALALKSSDDVEWSATSVPDGSGESS